MRCGRRRAERLLDRGGRAREEVVVQEEKEDMLAEEEEEEEQEIERLRPHDDEEEVEVVIEERAFWVAAEEKEAGKRHANGNRASFNCCGYRITETDAAGLVIENPSSNAFLPRVLVLPPALLVLGKYTKHCIKFIVRVSAARGMIRTSTLYL